MAVRIGHASISEKGTINGTKGDSTGNEVCIRTWYDKGWDFVAIHPDANIREKHAQAMEAACANNKIGYGQGDRNTANTEAKKVGYDLSKIKTACNTDCSALQNLCAVAAGTPKATYASNGWTTRTMRSKLKAAGYKIIEDATILKSASYCVRGAIYVAEGDHTVCGLDNGSKATATLAKAGLATQPSSTIVTASGKVVATDSAKHKDSSIAGSYVVTASALHIRHGAGTNKKSMTTLPQGTTVRCYGYYTQATSGTKWLYVQVKKGGITYTGFCSNKYLAKK